MRIPVAAALVLLAGCRQILGIGDPSAATDDARSDDGGTDPDGAADADAVPVDASTCYGPPGWELCFATLPILDAIVVPAGTLNTTSSPLCQPVAWVNGSVQPDACMIVGSSISVTGTTQAMGTRPLVLLATGSITISGLLDVKRAAGNAPVCSDAILPMDSTTGTGGGGAGGSNQSRGGGSTGGATSCLPVTSPTILRGGMAGQTAGSGFGGTGTHAGGGIGGGAVYLVAGSSISITGAIDASGNGGGGGIYYGGGGGGGAGGMIALHAPTITAIGVLMANGGGGGTPGINDASTDAGDTPSVSAPLTAAAGGMFDGRATGGSGCARGMTAGNGQFGVAGGGGGCGFILANVATLMNASVSPGLTPFPIP